MSKQAPTTGDYAVVAVPDEFMLHREPPAVSPAEHDTANYFITDHRVRCTCLALFLLCRRTVAVRVGVHSQYTPNAEGRDAFARLAGDGGSPWVRHGISPHSPRQIRPHPRPHSGRVGSSVHTGTPTSLAKSVARHTCTKTEAHGGCFTSSLSAKCGDNGRGT